MCINIRIIFIDNRVKDIYIYFIYRKFKRAMSNIYNIYMYNIIYGAIMICKSI